MRRLLFELQTLFDDSDGLNLVHLAVVAWDSPRTTGCVYFILGTFIWACPPICLSPSPTPLDGVPRAIHVRFWSFQSSKNPSRLICNSSTFNSLQCWRRWLRYCGCDIVWRQLPSLGANLWRTLILFRGLRNLIPPCPVPHDIQNVLYIATERRCVLGSWRGFAKLARVWSFPFPQNLSP